jgi:site-specific DNA recombinase
VVVLVLRGNPRAGIPGPFGHAWGDTTIRGHACRGNGVVNNELCAGVLVWNRQRFIKNPNTGKRVSRPNFIRYAYKVDRHWD